MLIPEIVNKSLRSCRYSNCIRSLIPPSGITLIYAFTMNISIGAMFITAIIPGIIFAGSLMGVNYFLCIKKEFNFQSPKATTQERIALFKHSF